ncbi:TetR/AcrR family transcriptional regulator C-terminal domain-containing protein [Microbacterium sp. PAMC21962]|uniref:TetR/AcrR family transcriptional regulator C-terminal domain-containing protein n=1 Tax=Microbacterium sp. PAMC21962 TaxID=2861280 RepID=UPI001C630DD9|nr:TetR/AcrR family transcriptional regulator C-terminal domain-containing protein [Microbacterium sp. PAMC21962]QYF97123.1 TetR/AcrR family transcriptional regulator C-terminal domain-containing protein [Microbacterium sp. PAMC21962]
MSRRQNAPSRSAGRGPGQSAGIDAQRIVEVARGLEPHLVTVQAVARELGVDRSAVHYHVKDRERLLELVARDAFAAHFSQFRFPSDPSWQEGCRAYARALRDALVSTGSLVAYFRYDLEGGLDLLRPSELLLEMMLDAGFAPAHVAQASLMLANIAMSLAKDIIFIQTSGHHPQPGILRAALRSAPEEEFHALRVIMTSSSDLDDDSYGELQFDFALDVFISGLERLLAHDDENRAPHDEGHGSGH